jgi:hypothetical protein
MCIMDALKKRIMLFLVACIGTRALFVYLSKTVDINYLPYLGYLALIPAIGFTYIFVTGSRTTGAEVFGDKIWWNNLRPVHAALYALFAYSAINKRTYSWIFLLIDVIIGLISFLYFHYMNGDFAKLLR